MLRVPRPLPASTNQIASRRSRWASLSFVLAATAFGCDGTAESDFGNGTWGSGQGTEVETTTSAQALLSTDITSNFLYAEQQVLKAENRLANTAHPRYTPTNYAGGQWFASDKTDWRCGFFNGTEWLVYEALGDGVNGWRAKAEGRTRDFVTETTRAQTHDIGFKTITTYGHAFRLTDLEEFRPKIFEGANTLADRFLTQYGVTRSWNDTNGDVRVIIDNMMNLEVLFMAAELTSNTADRDRWLSMAVSHANKTEQNHIRDSIDPNVDGSTCHVYFYNLNVCRTWQGLSDSSTWTRGQGWAMYGFTMAHRYAKRWPQYAADADLFLATAQRTSDLYLRRLAEAKNGGDWVPLHDFDAAAGAPKDTSAAALAAHALIELSANPAVPADKRATYKAAAEAMLDSLRNPTGTAPYRTNATATDTAQESIILRATGSYTTAGGGIRDVEKSLSYADYYFVEALVRHHDTYGATPFAPGFLKGTRDASGVTLAWKATRGAVSYAIKRGDAAAGPFYEIATSTEPRYVDTTAVAGQPYHYVVTATNLALAESPSSNVASMLISPYTSSDIGTVGAAGSSSDANGIFTVRGAGADINGTADAFHFMQKPLAGNGTAIVRITGIQNTNALAKAGIMMRESLDPGARNVFVHITPTAKNGYGLQTRANTGGTTTRTVSGRSAINTWLRLVRSGTGTTFTASYSTNGTSWTTIGTATVAMPSSIYVGLAVTSHVAGTLNTSTFDNVTMP